MSVKKIYCRDHHWWYVISVISGWRVIFPPPPCVRYVSRSNWCWWERAWGVGTAACEQLLQQSWLHELKRHGRWLGRVCWEHGTGKANGIDWCEMVPEIWPFSFKSTCSNRVRHLGWPGKSFIIYPFTSLESRPASYSYFSPLLSSPPSPPRGLWLRRKSDAK